MLNRLYDAEICEASNESNGIYLSAATVFWGAYHLRYGGNSSEISLGWFETKYSSRKFNWSVSNEPRGASTLTRCVWVLRLQDAGDKNIGGGAAESEVLHAKCMSMSVETCAWSGSVVYEEADADVSEMEGEEAARSCVVCESSVSSSRDRYQYMRLLILNGSTHHAYSK